MVYYALFNEVTEAKSLLEQVALVCQGRSMYQRVLEAISQYVRYDLKALTSDPAVLLSSRPGTLKCGRAVCEDRCLDF